MTFKQLCLSMFLSVWCASGMALTIDVTGGSDNPIVIANTPFKGNQSGTDVARIIDENLKRSGLFDPLNRAEMGGSTFGSPVQYGRWRQLSAEYMVRGLVQTMGRSSRVSYELYNVITQELALNGTLQGSVADQRQMAHRISDKIFKHITGLEGVFSKSILYVTSKRVGKGRFNYRLLRADSDAQNPKILLESSEPIVSPSWSPDGNSVVYVSFEKERSEIYVQNIRSKQRRLISSFRGMNSAPEWSPDGRKIAFALSKDGNSEIYVLNLGSNQLRRVTNNQYAIDTEPSWYPDSQTLLFTSNRGGQPQLYRTNINGGGGTRVSFKGNYNARGRVFPNGKGMAFIHRQGGAYRIAVQDFASGTVKVLSRANSDESPSVAANSSLVMYSTQRGGKSSLGVVSIDGRTRYYLPAASRNVREPAWSR